MPELITLSTLKKHLQVHKEILYQIQKKHILRDYTVNVPDALVTFFNLSAFMHVKGFADEHSKPVDCIGIRQMLPLHNLKHLIYSGKVILQYLAVYHILIKRYHPGVI